MSTHVSTYVWEYSQQKGTTLLLLLAIADMASTEGTAYPSVRTLARLIRMSPRNTQRAIRSLVSSGELVVHENQGRNGTHLYQIRVNQTLPLFKPDGGGDNLSYDTQGLQIGDKPVDKSPGGDTQGLHGVTPRAEGGDTAMSPEPSTNQILNQGLPPPPVDKSESKPLRSLAVQEAHALKAKKEEKRAEREASAKAAFEAAEQPQ